MRSRGSSYHGEKTNVYLPMYGRGDFAQLRHAAADAMHPHVQKSVLRWRAATDYVMQITAQPADANCSCRRAARHAPRHTRGCSASHARTVSHIRQFAEKYSSAALAAVPPCAAFRLPAGAFKFHLRVRLRLPCLVAPFPQRLASDVVLAHSVRLDLHDAARDSLLASCAHSDMFVREEPARHYAVPNTNPVQYVKPDGLVHSARGPRVAFDTFILQHPGLHAHRVNRKNYGYRDCPGLLGPVLARGDAFYPAGFSVVGACYSSARRLINALSHTGDVLGHHVPGERFEHDSQTWATPTHRAFIVHHAAVTIARAAWMSVAKYAASSGRYAAAADADRRAASGVVLPTCRVAA